MNNYNKKLKSNNNRLIPICNKYNSKIEILNQLINHIKGLAKNIK